MTTSTLSPLTEAAPPLSAPAVSGPPVSAPPRTEGTIVASTTQRTTGRPKPATADRVPLLALIAPLLLFTVGIVDWVDGLDSLNGFSGLGELGGLGGLAAARDQGALSVTAGVLGVLSVVGFAWLTASLGTRLRHLPLAVPTALLAAFGAGATGAVWLGQVTGLLDHTIPTTLSSGGAVLTGVALGAALTALTVEGRLPTGSLALAGLAAALLLLPWGLGPLASLVLLIALAPLTHPAETR